MRFALRVACLAGWLAVIFAGGVMAHRAGRAGLPTRAPGGSVSVDLNYPCAVTSAAVAGRLLGRDRLSLADAKAAVPADSLGQTSLAELVQGLGRLGFAACPVRLSPDRLGGLAGRGPLIFFTNDSHFVAGLATGDGGAVWIEVDKSVWLPPSRVAAIWHGEVVIVRPDWASLKSLLDELGVDQLASKP